MTSGKKGKGVQSQSNRRAIHSSHDTVSKQQKDQPKVEDEFHDLQAIMENIQGSSSPKVSSLWRDVTTVCVFLLGLIAMYLIFTLLSSLVISIHETIDYLKRPDRMDLIVTSPYKVTSYDSDIALRNVMSTSTHLGLGQVKTSKIMGERMVVSLIPESASEDIQPEKPFRDIFFTPPSIQPTLCPDGSTLGFSSWDTLRDAVDEANILSAERFVRWKNYFSTIAWNQFGAFQDDALYYEYETVFNICPGVTLKGRKSPIFIDADNLSIQCQSCVVDVLGTHFSFGPQAKHVAIRGITFQGAQTSSLTFYSDGADVSFEECLWITNRRKSKLGLIADINSSSIVNFSNCHVVDYRKSSKNKPLSLGVEARYSDYLSIQE